MCLIVKLILVVGTVAVLAGVLDANSTQSRRSDDSRSRDEQAGRTRRPAKRLRATTEPTTYDEIPYWMCPDVICPAISSTCALVEHIEYETQYVVNGNRVRCRSCSYCLDMPSSSHSNSRRRRSSGLLQRIREAAKTCQLTCPEVHDTCQEKKLTPVHLGSTPCGTCPVCADSVLSLDVRSLLESLLE